MSTSFEAPERAGPWKGSVGFGGVPYRPGGGGSSVRVVAVVLTGATPAVPGVVSQLLEQVHGVVVVHDGAPDVRRRLADLVGDPRIDLVAPPAGSERTRAARQAAGVEHAIARDPDAVLLVDPDEPPPPDLVPDFVTALAGHDVAVGDRSAQRSRLPVLRRVLTALVALMLRMTTRCRIPDPRCPTRLLTVNAIRAVPLDHGGSLAEVAHLRAMLARGLSVTWVPIPSRARRGARRTTAGAARASLVLALALIALLAVALI